MLPRVLSSEFAGVRRVLFREPMAYAQALTNLRWVVTMPRRPEEEPALNVAENALTRPCVKTYVLSARRSAGCLSPPDASKATASTKVWSSTAVTLLLGVCG